MLIASTFWLVAASTVFATPDDSPALPPAVIRQVDFARDVEPILAQSCVSCHGAKKRNGGLALHGRTPALAGGDEGDDIVPGNSAASRLIRYVGGVDEDHPMPPDGFGDPLSPEQVGILRAWIDRGADWPLGPADAPERSDHWAFQAPKPIEPPLVRDAAWIRNPIDRFVLARLEAEAFHPTPEADRTTLIRRLSLDLVGLPPTIAEVDGFVADDRPGAYERVVDRLLASPRYGERWARRWLDLARYADTNGYEKDRERSIWPYRDWVIRALNADQPFDQFTIDQIAGDLRPHATVDQRVATGFHRNTMINEEGGTDVEEFRFASLVDRVATTGATWLGLTVQCAQCHTHKYDPITQRDYYRLMAFFDNTDEPDLDLPDPAVAAHRATTQGQIDRLEAGLAGRFPAVDTEPSWTTPCPVAASAASAPITISADGILTSGGSAPATERTEVRFAVGPNPVHLIRLEALADPGLPHQGPGRAANGNFVVGEVAACAVRADGIETPLRLRGIEADVEQQGFEVRHAVDGDPNTGWAVDVGGAWNRDHRATFAIEDTNPLLGATGLVVRIDQSHGAGHVLGRFRLALGTRPAAPIGPVAVHRAIRLATRFLDWQRELRPTRWDIAPPLAARSARGATLTALADGSILASGDKPNNDTYTVEVPLGPGPVTAVRLEALPHESLPEGGPGRAPAVFSIGNFLLSEATLNLRPPGEGEPRRLVVRDASADYAEPGRAAAHAVDGRDDTGWSIGGALGQPHAIVFRLAEPVSGAPGSRLVLTLEQKYIHQLTLGRFRISTTSQTDVPPAPNLPAEVEAVAVLPAPSRPPEGTALLFHHFLHVAPELAEARREIADLRRSLPRYTTTLVMAARPAEAQRTTRIRRRGEFLRPAAAVKAGTPAILHPLPSDAPTDRMALAQWLVADDNPLIGRVAMNRAWAAFFGRGLVATMDDFGTRGDRPTHPELLDWLATEFPRRGWSQKAMHRLIVTSATYRQSAVVGRDRIMADPKNERLARGARFRVDAEVIRDQALAAAGLLDARLGGRSVFPPQPAGVSALAYGQAAWPTSEGADRYRRGLYTYTKRTAPFAAFGTFDAPSPELACPRRERSNTPLQALTLLNDPALVEAARGLGRRILTEGPLEPTGRATLAYRLVLARTPEPDELTRLSHFVERQRDRITRGEIRAAEVNGGGDDPTLAAWTILARVLLNLDEAITRE